MRKRKQTKIQKSRFEKRKLLEWLKEVKKNKNIMPEACGLCSEPAVSNMKNFYLVRPTINDLNNLSSQGYNSAFWGYNVKRLNTKYSHRSRVMKLTPLRETLVCLLLAID